MDLKGYIDDTQWQQDQSPDFTDGQAYWAKIPNAVIELGFKPNIAGDCEISMRVRTGERDPAKATSFVSSYKVEVDGVVVPMALDTSKPNEQHDEFGGCHLGYIKGVWRSPDSAAHDFRFSTSKQFGGVDALYIVDQTANEARQVGYEEGYKQGLTDGSKGMYTQADLDKAKADAKAQGITEGKQIQLDYSKADLNLAP
jgi:hypothetical protein